MAKEYANSFVDNDYTIETEAAVKHGVQLAQRWISVEEELPELGVPVLLKFVNWTYGVGYYLQHKHRGCNFYSYIEPDIEFLFDAITHWRQIELK